MNTALSWIKAYVPDLDVTPQEYTEAMTLSGTKVEGYECLDKNLEKIVVGQIVKIERHPDADKLIICQVDIGSETIQIVTGAPNVKEGDKVPVVLDGGKVAGGHDGGPLPEDGIKIKKGKLRGIESNGMMCSIEELGSSRDMYPLAPESGIYILPEDTPVGADAVEVLGLHDTVFEYEITSNRVDCYSVVGIARARGGGARRPGGAGSCVNAVARSIPMILLRRKIVFSKGFHDFLSFISIVQKTFTQLPAPPCLLAPPRLPAAQCPLPFPYRIFGLLFNAEKVSAVFLFIFGPPLYHSV